MLMGDTPKFSIANFELPQRKDWHPPESLVCILHKALILGVGGKWQFFELVPLIPLE